MTIFFVILGVLLVINIILFQFSSGRNSSEKVEVKNVKREVNVTAQLLKV